MAKKRNYTDDDDIQPSLNELQSPKHAQQSDAEDIKTPAYESTLEKLNRPVIAKGRIYPERLEEGTARILVLHHGSAPDDIKCDLRQKEPLAQVSPDEVLSYEALSYVWGTEENPEFIVLCESRFAVTHNLADALKHLRLPTSDRLLWVDAICINQSDTEERETQVKSMHWIYKLATKVIAWLGPSDSASSLAYWPMDFIQKLDIPPVSATVCETYNNDTTNKDYSFRKLMDRPYWSRAWIVQEMMFAGCLVIQCGSDVVLYSTLENAFPKNKPAYSSRYSHESDSMHIHFQGDHEVKILRLDSKQICPERFLDCFLDRQCRIRHDNIFAFLNMFSDDIRERIPISYDTPQRELLLNTARVIITSSQSLYIIAIRGRQTPPCSQGDDKWQLKMPSWCPYLATPYECCSIEPQNGPTLIAEKAVVSFLFLARDKLRVKGFVIGRISRTISRHIPPRVGSTSWWDQSDFKQERKHYLKCLYLGLHGMPNDIHTTWMSMKATTRTLLAGRGEEGSDEDLIEILKTNKAVDVEGPGIMTLREIWRNGNSRLVCSFRLGRTATRAFHSSKMAPAAWVNRIALVPRTSRPGDVICSILGCSVPVVLRRRGKYYHVLGEAYVDTSTIGPFEGVVGLRDFTLG